MQLNGYFIIQKHLLVMVLHDKGKMVAQKQRIAMQFRHTSHSMTQRTNLRKGKKK